MYHLAEAYLMAAFICLIAAYLGALLFGAGVLAPLSIRVLGETAAAPLLRAYWPRYHGFAVYAGVAITLAASFGLGYSAVPLGYWSLVVAIAAAMTLCFFVGWRLIPAINEARDGNAQARFERLHRMDVMLVGVGLLLGVLLVLALVYVLPGQFTFWPEFVHPPSPEAADTSPAGLSA